MALAAGVCVAPNWCSVAILAPLLVLVTLFSVFYAGIWLVPELHPPPLVAECCGSMAAVAGAVPYQPRFRFPGAADGDVRGHGGVFLAERAGESGGLSAGGPEALARPPGAPTVVGVETAFAAGLGGGRAAGLNARRRVCQVGLATPLEFLREFSVNLQRGRKWLRFRWSGIQ